MDEEGGIRAQPTSAPVTGFFDWTLRTALIVVPEGTAYPSTYGTVLQTDVTCELCRALFAAYPPGRGNAE